MSCLWQCGFSYKKASLGGAELAAVAACSRKRRHVVCYCLAPGLFERMQMTLKPARGHVRDSRVPAYLPLLSVYPLLSCSLYIKKLWHALGNTNLICCWFVLALGYAFTEMVCFFFFFFSYCLQTYLLLFDGNSIIKWFPWLSTVYTIK